jgi:hypothetical protein
MKEVLLASAVIGTGLVTWSVRSLFRQDGDDELKEESPPKKVVQIPLAAVSRTWKLNDCKALNGDVVDLRDLAVVWRETEAEKGAPPQPRPTFRIKEIDEFFSEMVEKRRAIKGARRTIIIKLLKMLDEAGDCPSVVRKNDKEAEKKYTEDTFSLLATVPLYRHSLRVARKCAAKVKQEVMLPDLFIVSLAHDIGKIPSYHDRLYSTGDHPLISLVALNSIPEYASLPNRSELDRIVRGHHSIKPDNQLTDLLKHCDQEARREELGGLIGKVIKRDKTVGEKGMGNTQKPAPLPATEKPAAKDTIPPEEERDHPLGSMVSEEFPDLVKQEIPDWFNAEAILAAVKKRINQLDDTSKGTRWVAVSTNLGVVFANPDGLWAAVKEVSGNIPAILAADADEGTKRNLLYTVVWELSRVKDAIATEYMTAKYYTTQATVVTGAGKGFTTLLVPFRVEAFGETDASLEETKSSRMKKMVSAIRPKQVEVETCVM